MNLWRLSVLVGLAHLAAAASWANTIRGSVVGVSDGDTLTLLTPDKKSIKVRLFGIDAPEKAQPFGAASKKSLSDMVFRKQVRVQVQTTDRYGRTVGKVSVGRKSANLEQLRRGMAWWYVRYAPKETGYRGAESAAKRSKVGLWADPKPVAPWDFRRQGRARTPDRALLIHFSMHPGIG